MVGKSPNLGLFPFQMAFSWLVNGGSLVFHWHFRVFPPHFSEILGVASRVPKDVNLLGSLDEFFELLSWNNKL